MGRKNFDERVRHLATRDCTTATAFARRLTRLAEHFDATRKAPSIADALYRDNARTTLFQLEGLARACRDVVDERAFEALLLEFKMLEDGLGAIDFADATLKRIATCDDAPLRAFMLGRRVEACSNVDRQLVRDGWIADGRDATEAMARVLSILEDARWPKSRKERRRYREYYALRARGIQTRIEEGGFDFDELEAGVHELRRRIRWLSIIPASLDGLFVRDEKEPIEPSLAKYCTPDVVNSKFNQLPPRDDVHDPIVIDSSAFLAMSWLIAQIGVWKDRAQWSEAVVQAASALGDSAKNGAARAKRILGEDFVAHADVAKPVKAVVTPFVRDGVLARLAQSVV